MIQLLHYILPRQKGKTWQCIDRSAESGAVIVTRDINSSRQIKKIATQRGLSIPDPISVKQLLNDNENNHVKVPTDMKLIIDDADIILRMLLGHEIDTISMVQRDSDGYEAMTETQRRMCGLSERGI